MTVRPGPEGQGPTGQQFHNVRRLTLAAIGLTLANIILPNGVDRFTRALMTPDRRTLQLPNGKEINLKGEVFVGEQFLGVDDSTILDALSYYPNKMACPSWVVPYGGSTEATSFLIPATPGSMFKIKDLGGNPPQLFNSTLFPLSEENPPWLDITGANQRVIFHNEVEAYFCSQGPTKPPNSQYGDTLVRDLTYFGAGTIWKGYYVLVKPIRQDGKVVGCDDILKHLMVLNYAGEKDLILARLPIAAQGVTPRVRLPVVAKK